MPQLDHAARPSLVEVYERFFEDDIESLSRESVESLPRAYIEELVRSIDSFLREAQQQDYPAHAVMLDSLANPIIFADDPSEPRTTRRVKQVALGHHEVVIPFQPLIIDYRCAQSHAEAASYPGQLLEWSRRNARLLREHVFSVTAPPSLFDALGHERASEVAVAMREALIAPDFENLRSRIVRAGESQESKENAIDSWLMGGLRDAVYASSLGSNLAFVDQNSGLVYELLLQFAGGQSVDPEIPHITEVGVLQSLDMPAIDDLPDEEFVAIRLHAEDFEEFRGALGRVLSKTRVDHADGRSLREAFRDNLDEIHVRADALRRHVKDRALRRFLRSSVQGISLGAVVSTASSATADLAAGQVRPDSLAARFLTTMALATVFAAVFYKPAGREQRMLRFYDVLLDERVM